MFSCSRWRYRDEHDIDNYGSCEGSGTDRRTDHVKSCESHFHGRVKRRQSNSGYPFTAFRGFTKEIREYEVIDTVTAAAAFAKATETAYKAVMKPKEGTILTVARGMAEKAAELASETDDLADAFEKVIEYGDYVLSQTPELLPVLKQAGVVDSGGQGLMEVLKGAFDCMMGKEVDFEIGPSGVRQRVYGGRGHIRY